MFFIGGILKHAPALTCLTTINSYKRLVSASKPVNLALRAQSLAAIRTDLFTQSESKAIEFRTPDAAANPYLAFSAMLVGLDGVKTAWTPAIPDKKSYELPPEELAQVASP